MEPKDLQKILTAVDTKAKEDRTLVVKISTPTPDRSSDIMVQSGIQIDNYMKNPVVLFGHNYSGLPIAKCDSITINAGGSDAVVKFPNPGVYDLADTVYEMYKEGYLNAWSIGFRALEWDYNELGGRTITKWELYEFSAVPVPDNPEALTMMKNKGFNIEGFETKEVEQSTETPTEDVAPSEEETTTEEQPTEEPPVEEEATVTDDAKIADLTVAQLKDLIADTISAKKPDIQGEPVPATEEKSEDHTLSMAKRLVDTIDDTRKSLKETDKAVGLTLRLLKTLEEEGGEQNK